MKQKLLIFLVLFLMVAVLAGLNAASYSQRQKTPETEDDPNRSSYNAGPTGTQAYYSLLSETGRRAVRWLEPLTALNKNGKDAPSVFVVVGPVRRDMTDDEMTSLFRWVSLGGRLVIIDREPPNALVKTTANWKLTFTPQNRFQMYGVDPTDQTQMTANTPAAKPVQPDVYTHGVNAVQTSQFASSISFEPYDNPDGISNGISTGAAPPPPRRVDSTDQTRLLGGVRQGEGSGSGEEDEPPPPSVANRKVAPATPPPTTEMRTAAPADRTLSPSLYAPVIHFTANGKNILVDVPFAAGRIIYLSDPYVVSNAGIALVDNAQLGIDLVAERDAVIAFDEYHQGFGGNNNRFFEFFAGTPVIAIFAQMFVLVGLAFLSRSRRFGRPLPEHVPDRLSKLEYVAAMAELQQRTRAYDLAIENIYNDFRRRAARLVGIDPQLSSRTELATRIAERAGIPRERVEDLLFKCEDIIAGEPTNKRETVGLTTSIREIEHLLGLDKAAR